MEKLHTLHVFFFSFLSSSPCLWIQEANSEKTNNGIHYRLQLLYSNGKGWEPPMSAPPPPTVTTTGCPPAAPRLETPPGPEEPLLPSPPLRASPRSVLRAQPDWGGQLRPRKLRRVRALGRTPLLGRWPRRSSLLCLFSGIRTEQDFYVRLIDSMTKQVGAAGSGRGKGECVRTCMCACLGGERPAGRRNPAPVRSVSGSAGGGGGKGEGNHRVPRSAPGGAVGPRCGVRPRRRGCEEPSRGGPERSGKILTTSNQPDPGAVEPLNCRI